MKRVLVYGSAGSGKTTYLAHKYAELLEKGYKPNEIVYISYTKFQTRHGARKIKAITKVNRKQLEAHTLHSFSKRAVDKDTKVLHDGYVYDMTNFLKTDMLPVVRGISYMKNTMTKNDAIGANKSGMNVKSFQKRKYFYEVVKQNMPGGKEFIDFSDMIERAITHNIKSKAKVVICDECQDFTPLHWKAIYTAFRDVDEMYLAGDPNQSLYRFHGAVPNYMFEIGANETVILDEGHRCCEPVLKMAQLIANKMTRSIPLPTPVNMRDCFAVFYPDKNIFPLLSAINYSRRHGHKVMILANTYYQLDLTRKKLLGPYKNYPHHFFAGRERTFYKGHERNPLIFSTVHQAKGQEADIVLYNVSCGSVDEFTDFGTKSERWDDYWKIVYTGITRAKRGLVVFQLTNPTYDEPNCLETLYYSKFNYEKYREWFSKKGNTKHYNEYLTESQDNT